MTELELQKANNLYKIIEDFSKLRTNVNDAKGYVSVVIPFDMAFRIRFLSMLDQRIAELKEQFAAI